MSGLGREERRVDWGERREDKEGLGGKKGGEIIVSMEYMR